MITVILPVYKTPVDWIVASVQSILQQSFKDFALFIVDDGSDSPDISRCLTLLQKSDSRIHLFRNEKNKGLVYTLNSLLDMVQTEWIARMDSDDIAEPDRFFNQIKYIKQAINPIDVLGAYITPMGTNRITKYPTSHEQIKLLMPWRCCIAHPTVMYRKSVVQAVGGYPNVANAEDYALWSKILRETDARFGVVPLSLLNYRHVSGRVDYSKIQQMNTFAIQREWFQWAHLSEDQINSLRNFLTKGHISSLDFQNISSSLEAIVSRIGRDVILSSADKKWIEQMVMRKVIKCLPLGLSRLIYKLKYLLNLYSIE